jgi:hypothetical protein
MNRRHVLTCILVSLVMSLSATAVPKKGGKGGKGTPAKKGGGKKGGGSKTSGAGRLTASAGSLSNTPTPMGAALKVNSLKMIAAECTERGSNFKQGVYHYDLYLPPGYDKETDRMYPCLFVSSPMGKPHGHFKMFLTQARKYKWIVVLLIEARNGPFPPILSNFVAAHDDVVQRCRVQTGMKYSTGSSGGAVASGVYVTLRKGFGGLMVTGQLFLQDGPASRNRHLAVYWGFGRECFNRVLMPMQMNALGRGMAHQWEVPLAGHGALSPEFYRRAFQWHEEYFYLGRKTIPVELAVWKFQDKLAMAADAPGDMWRYAALNFAVSLAAKRGLAKKEELTEKVQQAGAQLAELKQDEALKKELAARDAFRAAFRKEQDVWYAYVSRGANRNVFPNAVAAIDKNYQAVIDTYGGTRSATRATERIKEVHASESIRFKAPGGGKKH